MKKLEKGAYDDSDDEKNPYASSVRLISCLLYPLNLIFIPNVGGGRGGRGTAPSSDRSCDTAPRTKVRFAIYFAGPEFWYETPIVKSACPWCETGLRISRDFSYRSSRESWRTLCCGQTGDESQSPEVERQCAQPRRQSSSAFDQPGYKPRRRLWPQCSRRKSPSGLGAAIEAK